MQWLLLTDFTESKPILGKNASGESKEGDSDQLGEVHCRLVCQRCVDGEISRFSDSFYIPKNASYRLHVGPWPSAKRATERRMKQVQYITYDPSYSADTFLGLSAARTTSGGGFQMAGSSPPSPDRWMSSLSTRSFCQERRMQLDSSDHARKVSCTPESHNAALVIVQNLPGTHVCRWQSGKQN
jgi:hypothetical protein